MKNFYFLLIFIGLLSSIICCKKMSKSAYLKKSNFEGLYHYTYPIKTSTLDADIYIILKKSGDQLEGYYYGTTDEFVDVSEGYYPGFFVLPMDSLRIKEDSIYFVLMPQTKDFFTQPVSRNVFSTKEALNKGYSHWDNYDHYYFAKLRKYKGFFIDSVTLFFDKDSIYNINSKKFLKVKK
jgi:hypothetical protein